MEEFDKLVSEIKTDYAKHLTGNKASATRTRVALAKLAKLSKALRAEILAKTKAE